jgi:hypothetical protein
MRTPIHTFLFVAAVLCFLAAAVGSWVTPEPWPYHGRLVALGLFFWAMSGEFTA